MAAVMSREDTLYVLKSSGVYVGVWKTITFLCNLYSFGLEVLSCGVVLSLCRGGFVIMW